MILDETILYSVKYLLEKIKYDKNILRWNQSLDSLLVNF